MKTSPLLLAAGALALVAGCATGPDQISRAPIDTRTPFTMSVLHLTRLDVPPKATDEKAQLVAEPMVKKAGDRYAIVQCVVDTGGITRDVQCMEASDASSAQTAVTLISRSRLVHAKTKDGKPMAVKVEYGIVFHPEQSGLVMGPRFDDHMGPTPTAEQVPISPATGGPFPNSTYTPQGGGM